MSLIRRRHRSMPSLNTASLPDLIFVVLFFFMIVTHMRTETLKVEYTVPKGTELTHPVKKSTVVHIHIGKPIGHKDNSSSAVQINGRIVPIERIAEAVSAERASMLPEDKNKLTISLKADRKTPMSIITAVKQQLRKANALNISYSAEEKEKITAEGLKLRKKEMANYLSIPINIRNFAAAFRMEAKGCCAFWYG